MPQAEPLLTIGGVTKRYADGTLALNRTSLEIGRGQIVVLIGPSGCGKSTLLRLIAGLERPSSGELRLSGRRLDGPSPEIGVVFQEPRLMPWLTVTQNVAFGLSRRLSRAQRREQAQKVIERVGLGRFAQALPKALSGGMAQRAALARALATRPPVLLLDEPFSALDAILRGQLQSELLRLWEQDRQTMVLVTHDLDEAVLMADRVVVMRGQPGEIGVVQDIALPRPRERHRPAFQMLRAKLLAELPSLELKHKAA